MRKLIHIALFVLSLMLVVIGTSAQTEERTGYILHLAKGGVITAFDDDFYLMTLNNTADFNAVVLVEPSLFLFNYSLRDFVADWEAANSDELLLTTGKLELNDYTIDVEVTVAELAYDMLGNTFTYQVRFLSELPEEWVDKRGNLAEEVSFERATLALDVNDTFTMSLRAGQQARLSGTRNSTKNPPFP